MKCVKFVINNSFKKTTPKVGFIANRNGTQTEQCHAAVNQ